MVVEVRRYLGNTLSAHVHDADHENSNCRLGQIATKHRRWYDSLEEARSDQRYEGCSWCIGDFNPGSVGAATSVGTA